MTFLDLIAANLLSPAVLCFALGAFAVFVRSDLAMPEAVFTTLSIYLMLSIGLRGGGELMHAPWREVAWPLVGALGLGCAIPVWCYALLRWRGLSVVDSAAMAAHYGSVSALTFAAVTALLDRQGVTFEGYSAALLAVMEVPAIVVAIALAGMAQAHPGSRPGSGVITRTLASKSVLLLAGGLVIGAVVGPAGLVRVKPFFGDMFQGALCLFLLELGRAAAGQAAAFRRLGWGLAAFAIVMPVLHAAVGIGVAHAAGMSMGGAVVLGTLAASASYIAAPAAVRLALPEANPGYTLTCSVAITFPFNIALGIPLYQAMAAWLYR